MFHLSKLINRTSHISKRYLSSFVNRHVGSCPKTLDNLSEKIGFRSADDLIDKAIPKSIRGDHSLSLPNLKRLPETGLGEHEALEDLSNMMRWNKAHIRSLIGMGYYDTLTPLPIQRNMLENPGWYTPYTPYQAEISQGRLEQLINYQTMIASLTGLEYANASLLDEASAATEALSISWASRTKDSSRVYLVDKNAHPQTISLIRGRAETFPECEIIVGDPYEHNYSDIPVFGLLLQYPNTRGLVYNAEALKSHFNELKSLEHRPIIAMATDLLALTLLTPPGEMGADIALGNSQRFGVPLGAGGPHAAFFATTSELIRKMPGRIIGFTRDSQNNRVAFRLTLQTREQHIKRSKATSNICTAQALLANVATAYAIYHGPQGLKSIAENVNNNTQLLMRLLQMNNPDIKVINHSSFFDTLEIESFSESSEIIINRVREKAKFNLRSVDLNRFTISIDETILFKNLTKLTSAILDIPEDELKIPVNSRHGSPIVPESSIRQSPYLTQPVFNTYHTETELMRYLHRLEVKDLGLNNSMIPLGSCTMKLNATAEMIPISWPFINRIHPYAPIDQLSGYVVMTAKLREWLADITGFADVSLQPNSGATGEYAGLRVIQAYLRAQNQQNPGSKLRDICLIPDSAHGTNPASASMAGFRIVTIKSDVAGNVDMDHLREMVHKHSEELGALMVTYPSTYGVFEENIGEMCELVHQHGGQVYMDGANMNAQVGITSPGLIGADVCHLNLHKTFCIPHGGGGPGMGPIGVAEHLVPFLPKDPLDSGDDSDVKPSPPVAASRWSSASILPITYQYISLMGSTGLLHATKAAIIHANYMLHRLKDDYKILYTNPHGLCAHEFIIDLRPFHKSANITAIDVGKRLQDYGFHAPTLSWPVVNTIMIEPTESETREEMDRYCDALIQIRDEIREIEQDPKLRENNVLKNAPHTVEMVSSSNWPHNYSREKAAYPLPHLRKHKHWPTVGRVDEIYGDKQAITNWIQWENKE